jgi:hypothetical protein
MQTLNKKSPYAGYIGMTLEAALRMLIDSGIQRRTGLRLTTHPLRAEHMNWVSFTIYRVNIWSCCAVSPKRDASHTVAP